MLDIKESRLIVIVVAVIIIGVIVAGLLFLYHPLI
jgi:hypothetical protein